MSRKCCICQKEITDNLYENFNDILINASKAEHKERSICSDCFDILIDRLACGKTYEDFLYGKDKLDYVLTKHPIEDEHVKKTIDHYIAKAEVRAIEVKHNRYNFNNDAWWYETKEEHAARMQREERARVEKAKADKRVQELHEQEIKKRKAEAQRKLDTKNTIIKAIWCIIVIWIYLLIPKYLNYFSN